MQSHGLVQRLVVLRLEQRVPASLSHSLASVYILVFCSMPSVSFESLAAEEGEREQLLHTAMGKVQGLERVGT